MITIKLPNGYEISGETPEEVENTAVRFNRVVSTQEIADIAGVSLRTVARWRSDPDFPNQPVTLLELIQFVLKQRKTAPN